MEYGDPSILGQEDEVGWNMVIHLYWDKDIYYACLVG
jgi:hypothetical protein